MIHDHQLLDSTPSIEEKQVTAAIKLTIHQSLLDVEPSAWDELALASRGSTIYHTHQWARLWLEHFGTDIELRLFALHQGDRLVGLLPMKLASQRLGRVFCRRRLVPLSAASPPAPQYLGPLLDPTCDGEGLALFARALSTQREADAICFENYLPLQPAAALVERIALERQASIVRWEGEASWSAPLAASLDQYLQTLPRKLRKNLISARNRFAKTAGGRIEGIHDMDGAEAAVEAFRSHSIARLGSKGLDSTMADPRMARFFHELILESLALGRGLYFSAWVGDRCIGTIFGLRFGSWIGYYNGSFDPDHAALSPGTLLIDALSQAAIELGHRRLDMLAGFGDYKRRWGGESTLLQFATVPLGGLRNIPFSAWESYKARRTAATNQPETDDVD